MPNRDDMMRLPFDPSVCAVRADTERRREDEKRMPTVQRDPKLVAFETQRHEVGGGGSFNELVRECIRLAASNHMKTWCEKFLNVEGAASVSHARVDDVPLEFVRGTDYSIGVDLAQDPDQTVVLTYRRPDDAVEAVFIKKENQSTALRSLRTLANTPQAARSLPEIPDVKPRGWLPMPEDLNDLRGLKIRWVKHPGGAVNDTALDDITSGKILARLLDGRTPRGRIAAYSTDWECPND